MCLQAKYSKWCSVMSSVMQNSGYRVTKRRSVVNGLSGKAQAFGRRRFFVY